MSTELSFVSIVYVSERIERMENGDSLLVKELTDTFNYQMQMYRELKVLVQKMIGKLVISRGDMSGLLSSMEQKQKIIESIESERSRHSDAIMQWQLKKNNVTMSPEVGVLEKVLECTGCAIRDFIDEEEQLKIYLEKCIRKS
ncbi:MAG: hypothetical protein JW915_18005 [Chitinispirillaceae bacterium]|nr:hypothetical protein [Chitinispirillaceae bacterium]